MNDGGNVHGRESQSGTRDLGADRSWGGERSDRRRAGEEEAAGKETGDPGGGSLGGDRRGGSASSVAKRYCKAMFGDQKTVVELTAYDWKQLQLDGYEDEEEYFEKAGDRWDEDIRS